MSIEVNIFNLIRENIRQLKPYTSARDEFSGDANIFLDANENSYGSVSNLESNRYPDPYQTELKKKIAKLKHVPEKNIFIGNGSDEAIDLLIKLFCYPGKDKIIITPPTYGMYKVQADINDIECIEVPLVKTFEPDSTAICKIGQDTTVKMVFLCSPNNPTGNILNQEYIMEILDSFNGIVVIDEAYIDFSGTRSLTALLPEFPNLVILQTLSKAWGLAALRIGLMFAHEEIIRFINKIKLPYNISGIVQKLASDALNNNVQKELFVQKILNQKQWLKKQLQNLSCVKHIYPSDANFFLVKTTDANTIYKYLINKGIVVRNRSNVTLCYNCLRITVGTETENKYLIEALSKFE
ncbi:MAG: histidinol-phosphate transaminase [Bacteroidales bacterium]